MASSFRRTFNRARVQILDDLRSDPYLPYILLLATVLSSFWFWHLLPNTATRDEQSRLLHPLLAFGSFLADPSLDGFREGLLASRTPFGATFYLNALALVPVVIVAALTDQFHLFFEFADASPVFGYYPAWHATPAWFWTASLALVRLFNVAFAVGSVYLAYRIGVALADRATGRLAALLLTVTFGFITLAHEGGEDMPAAFFVLLTLYLALRYVYAGRDSLLFAASAAGGVAIALKLTAAPVVALIATALLLRARRTEQHWSTVLLSPRLVVGGALIGFAAIVLGFPTALVAGPEPFFARVFGESTWRMQHTTGPDAPIWWWFLRGYFSALGLPLFVAAVVGVAVSATRLRPQAPGFDGTALVVVGLLGYVLMLSQWHDFRVHHLLPTFPLLALLTADALVRFRDQRPSIARPLLALLLLTTAVYAGVGTAGYATMPRDQATDWLATNADENETVQVYRVHVQDTAVPHGMDVNYADAGEKAEPCPEYIQLNYRDLLYLYEDAYYWRSEEKGEYVRSLLDGERGYEIVAEFGPRPPGYVPDRPTPGSVTDILWLGIVPQTDQYADEQELRPNQYTVILERTDRCNSSASLPF